MEKARSVHFPGTARSSSYSTQYVNERQSVLRGIKDGWYAMDAKGILAFGPFFNRETCLSRIDQLASWSKSSALRHRPD
jgi:hypothetical protein